MFFGYFSLNHLNYYISHHARPLYISEDYKKCHIKAIFKYILLLIKSIFFLFLDDHIIECLFSKFIMLILNKPFECAISLPE